ncbi:MAG: hypothetical protein NTAFB01_34040 [Nitrospira sp.]
MTDRLSLKQHYVIVIVLFSAIIALCYCQPVVRLLSKVPIDPNEGWNAFNSNHLRKGEPLYPPYDTLISNNYPPLSFYLNASLATLLGDDILAGRVLSLISLLAVAGVLGACVVEMGGRGAEAVIMSLFFLAFIAMFADHYIGMADPQWFSHAVQLSGFYLLLKSRNRGTLFYLSILMMVTSGFIKQNLIVLPLAVFLWLFVCDRAAIVRFSVAALSAVCFFLFSFTMIHGVDFLRGLFLDQREWHLETVAKAIGRQFNKLMAVLLLGVSGCVLLPKSGTLILLSFYFILACLWGAFIYGGSGVDVNALFDVVIAAVLIGGVLLRHADRVECRNQGRTSRFSVLILAVLVVALVVPLSYELVKAREFWKTRERVIESVAEDIRYLSDVHGPAMCESLALCYWAGKKFEGNDFMTRQKIRTGLIDRWKLTDLIESRYFSVIQINNDNGKSDRFDDVVNSAIHNNYRIDRKSPYRGVFLVTNK